MFSFVGVWWPSIGSADLSRVEIQEGTFDRMGADNEVVECFDGACNMRGRVKFLQLRFVFVYVSIL